MTRALSKSCPRCTTFKTTRLVNGLSHYILPFHRASVTSILLNQLLHEMRERPNFMLNSHRFCCPSIPVSAKVFTHVRELVPDR